VTNPRGELDRLQRWYEAQCDGDWEHEWGAQIETLDNPGWAVRISLEETSLAWRTYPRTDFRRSDSDRVMARVSDDVFQASCGPLAAAVGGLAEPWASASFHRSIVRLNGTYLFSTSAAPYGRRAVVGGGIRIGSDHGAVACVI
jgi:hypothetical protein